MHGLADPGHIGLSRPTTLASALTEAVSRYKARPSPRPLGHPWLFFEGSVYPEKQRAPPVVVAPVRPYGRCQGAAWSSAGLALVGAGWLARVEPPGWPAAFAYRC